MTKYIVTGCAGFIGFHLCQDLLKENCQVIGVDNLNDYYSPALKEDRLSLLSAHKNFEFLKLSLEDKEEVEIGLAPHKDCTLFIHLAAQAGVRYSLQNPYSYIQSNVMAQTVLLEWLRNCNKLEHFLYASSSSVYGIHTPPPFKETASLSQPASLYAASKLSCEHIAHVYHHIYGIASTGFRFFTVYGPWGRPDMAPYIFTDAIFNNKTLKLFNHGDMKRDFTYIDDIIQGLTKFIHLDKKPSGHSIYNLGNHKSIEIPYFIEIIEKELQISANIQKLPMQPGDVYETCADISLAEKDFDFHPRTSIEEGMKHYIDWFQSYYTS